MPTGTGITADTPVLLAVGAGVILRDHAYLGPTVDNNLFGLERELFTPDLNGLLWALAETDYLVSSVPRIEATVPQVGGDAITSGIAGATVDTGTPGMTVISDVDTRRFGTSDYHGYELDLDRPNGGQFQFEIDHAINTGGWEGELQDDGLFAPRLVLTGRGTAASPETSPWRIRLLDTAS